MESIIIPSTKSLTLTNNNANGNINEDNITVGNINQNNITVGNDELYTYSSFLFFDISTIPGNAEISNAELILFKTDNFYENIKKCIYIYPLSDLSSNYTIYKNPLKGMHRIECSLSRISVTANITKIVSLWFKNTVSNKGIILYQKKRNFITNFGSAMCKDRFLIPFIKVSYSIKNTIIEHKKLTKCKNGCNFRSCNFNFNLNLNLNPNPGIPTTRQIQIIGIVAPVAIYGAVINLAVTRSHTGHIDNYYVTDEYDNSTNNTPLSIDKIYNIDIFPQKNIGDTENVAFYGSYIKINKIVY